MRALNSLRYVRSWIELALVVCLILAALAALAAFGKARLTATVYAQRLQETQAAYREVREHYNRAVKRTAVTELQVSHDEVAVVVRTDRGVTRRILTACDPRREIYVDYVVVDGRLWIRRVFDDSTEPRRGTLIDPALGELDWQADGANVGKAVYRQLTPGRWVVTVTGNGALGLQQAPTAVRAQLEPAPRIQDFTTMEAEIEEARESISVAEMLRAAMRGGSGRR